MRYVIALVVIALAVTAPVASAASWSCGGPCIIAH
jgi:hypothetical protein